MMLGRIARPNYAVGITTLKQVDQMQAVGFGPANPTEFAAAGESSSSKEVGEWILDEEDTCSMRSRFLSLFPSLQP